MGIITGYSRRTANIGSGGGGSVATTLYNSDDTLSDQVRLVSLYGNTSSDKLIFQTLSGDDVLTLYGNSKVDLGSITNYVSTNIYLDAAGVDTFKFYRGASAFLNINPSGYSVGLISTGGKQIQLNGGNAWVSCYANNAGFYAHNLAGQQIVQLDIQGSSLGYLLLKSGASNRVGLYAGDSNYFVDKTTFGGTVAHSSALVDIQTTTKGLGLPTMTTAEKNAIVAPRTGLCVFDSTLGAISAYNGAAWI